jgi:hypothetical protein
MKAAFYRWLVPVLMFCSPLIVLAGCDDDHHGHDLSTDGILSIIFAIGDVVLAIIASVT